MASVIKIKRSATAASPTTLASGELAYSWFNDTNKLYFGKGDNGSGGATEIQAIGGQYYTKYLDHTPGTLTASAALLVDANKKINELLVDNITVDGSTVSTIADTNLVLTSSGTGLVAINSGANQFTLPGGKGTAGYVLTTDGAGVTSWAAPSTTLTVGADTGADQGVALLTDTIDISGDTGITTTVSKVNNLVTISVDLDDTAVTVGSYGSATKIPTFTVDQQGRLTAAGEADVATNLTVVADNASDDVSLLTEDLKIVGGEGRDSTLTTVGTDVIITISGEDASTTNKGIASFNTDDFDVTSGDVTLKDTVVKSITTDSGALTPSTHAVSILGGEGVDVTHSGATITIAGEDASTTNKGIASFDSGDFDVTLGVVTIKAAGVGNAQLENSDITVGSTTISLGGTSTSLAGLTELTVDNLNFNGNEISSTDANGNISLNPNGTGTVDVNGARITGVGAPTTGTDAANKTYVDNAVSGLSWKDSVHLLANTSVALTGNTNSLIIDGHPALDINDVDYRILLKGQNTASENGIYVYNDDGATYTLTRARDADAFDELIGAAVFVKEGTTYANTGWVQSNHYITDFSNQSWTQFAGAGAYTAGDGLTQSGTTFNVGAGDGITVNADTVALASTTAGAGLTFTAGVLAVVGTADRITVNADSIDIASTYVGQNTITTLGTITTGTWQGNTVAVSYGGTGITTATANGILYGNGTSALGVTAASTIDGSFLRGDSTGNPYWSNVIDGGTY